jgi:hypothetical protein
VGERLVSDDKVRDKLLAAMRDSARKVEKAATFEDKRFALWDQTNSVLLIIAYELSNISMELELRNG